ncbi:uncharacterized protein LAJ45_07744 [Morchella importuna]|uniref:uncharacterized protein n=1 Tax=Morchella importuna TaxID=1174673 RepID=UPI001E8D69AB|nr:uncharacterized protein LAJ45_07744 [Morchella importuna]KAH8148291.1 hypothetical protein LAJ45_07744 [Morchella importuna]
MIPKSTKSDYSLAKIYRPIFLLQCFSKVLEKIVATRLCTAGSTLETLTKDQIGVRPTISAVDALLRTLTPIQQNLLLRQMIGVTTERPALLMNDIQGAFNRVNHHSLAEIMIQQKFPHYLINWCKEFNTNRTLQFQFKHELEPPQPYNSRLPQGSLLSPVLFMIYAGVGTDPITFPKEIKTTYMDNDALVQLAKTPLLITKSLNERMAERVEKAAPLNIKYEPQKSDLVFFKPTTSCNATPKNSVVFATEEVHPKDMLKYVDVWLDPNLYFQPHIEEIIAKGLKALGKIRNIAYLPGTTVKAIHNLVVQGFLPTILWDQKHDGQELTTFCDQSPHSIIKQPE